MQNKNFNLYARKYLNRFGYDKSFYKVLVDQSRSSHLGNYTICAGLVASVATGNFEDIRKWVDKADSAIEATGAIEVLRTYSRRVNPNWVQEVIPLIEEEVGSLDSINVNNKTVNITALLIGALEKLANEELSQVSKNLPETNISLENLASEVEQFLDDPDPYKRTFELLSLKKIDSNEIKSNAASLFVLSTAKEYRDEIKGVREKLLTIFNEIKSRPIYMEPEKPKEKPLLRFKAMVSSWRTTLSFFLLSFKRRLWIFLIVASLIAIIRMLVVNWHVIALTTYNLLPISQNSPTATMLVMDTPLPVMTATSLPSVSIAETNLPVGILIYESVLKSDSEDIISRPIRYIYPESQSSMDIDFTELLVEDVACMNSADKPLFFYKFNDNFLLLSTAFPCGDEYKINARLFLDQGSARFVANPSAGENVVIDANNLLSSDLSQVDLIRLIEVNRRFYVSFLASKDQEKYATPYWLLHNLSGGQFVFSFFDAGDGVVEIEKKRNLSEATRDTVYNIHSYEWVDNKDLLFLIERKGVYQWIYMPLNFEELGNDITNPENIVISPQIGTILSFSLNKDGSIALIYQENGVNYYKYCKLNNENNVICNAEPVPLIEFKDIYQIMWSPNNMQVAFTASTSDVFITENSEKSVQMDCSNGCLFLADVNPDGSLGESKLVKNVIGISSFWWIDQTIPVIEGE